MRRLHGQWTEEDRFLGMDRAIPRRDFLQGVAVAVAGSLIGPAATAATEAGAVDPSELGGLRGQDPEAMRLGHHVRDGKCEQLVQNAVDTGESYDLRGDRRGNGRAGGGLRLPS